MVAPRIDYSSLEETLEFIKERFHCKAPACGDSGAMKTERLTDRLRPVKYRN